MFSREILCVFPRTIGFGLNDYYASSVHIFRSLNGVSKTNPINPGDEQCKNCDVYPLFWVWRFVGRSSQFVGSKRCPWCGYVQAQIPQMSDNTSEDN